MLKQEMKEQKGGGLACEKDRSWANNETGEMRGGTVVVFAPWCPLAVYKALMMHHISSCKEKPVSGASQLTNITVTI